MRVRPRVPFHMNGRVAQLEEARRRERRECWFDSSRDYHLEPEALIAKHPPFKRTRGVQIATGSPTFAAVRSELLRSSDGRASAPVALVAGSTPAECGASCVQVSVRLSPQNSLARIASIQFRGSETGVTSYPKRQVAGSNPARPIFRAVAQWQSGSATTRQRDAAGLRSVSPRILLRQ